MLDKDVQLAIIKSPFVVNLLLLGVLVWTIYPMRTLPSTVDRLTFAVEKLTRDQDSSNIATLNRVAWFYKTAEELCIDTATMPLLSPPIPNKQVDCRPLHRNRRIGGKVENLIE